MKLNTEEKNPECCGHASCWERRMRTTTAVWEVKVLLGCPTMSTNSVPDHQHDLNQWSSRLPRETVVAIKSMAFGVLAISRALQAWNLLTALQIVNVCTTESNVLSKKKKNTNHDKKIGELLCEQCHSPSKIMYLLCLTSEKWKHEPCRRERV